MAVTVSMCAWVLAVCMHAIALLIWLPMYSAKPLKPRRELRYYLQLPLVAARVTVEGAAHDLYEGSQLLKVYNGG